VVRARLRRARERGGLQQAQPQLAAL